MSAAFDESVLATLTDEERAAIESDELSDSEKEALKSIAGDEDEGEGEGEGGAPPVEGKGAAGSTEDADAAQEADAQDDAGQDERTFRPAFKADAPEDYEQQMSDLNAKVDELAQQFKNGDIDFDQYRSEVGVMEAKRNELNSTKLRADLYHDMAAQSAEQEWQWTVKRFLRSTAKAGDIDYAKDEAKRNDLDSFVKAIASVAANADKDYDWFLAEAHKRVKALHGLSAPAKPSGNTPTPNRKPPTDAVPVTLANVPGSDGPGDLAGEFADLDGLEGDALEMAIAKMTPEQRDKYARGV